MRLLRLSGLDKAVSLTLFARVWTIAGGIGTLFFVTRYLTPELQGYYYTFNSLVALQIFVELGLNYAIVQFASHEMASLSWESNATLIGDPMAKRRLQSLLHFSFAWFGVAALLVLAVLLPAGIIFFKSTAPANGQVQPGWAWGLVILFTSIVVFINAALAILEGCNRVIDVAKIRFGQSFASIVVVWIALAYDAGLYALAFGSCMMAAVGAIGIYTRYRHFFIDLWRSGIELPGIHWKNEIWPFQWRIAVSWASGYLIFQIFTPLLFATHGPIAAGQMGMSLQIISAMNSAAIVWISTKAPLFGQLISQNNRSLLDSTFKAALMQSSIFLAIGITAAIVILIWMQIDYPAYAIRVVNPSHFLVLCIACFANHIIFSEAVYLRAHKEEPFMVLSVISGLTTVSLALIFVPPFGTLGAVGSYSFGAIVISFIGATAIFIRKRRRQYA